MELRRREFHIRQCLGRGGFGEVYRATMTSTAGLRTEVAVKVLRADVSANSQAVQRLRDEGRMLAAVNHPAILQVYDLALLDGRVALVTEYVEGEDLLQCLQDTADPIPTRALIEAIGQVAEALHTAYSAPREGGGDLALVHRDIKPSNVRISRHGQVKLLDFGIAHSTDGSREAKTSTNVAVGSLPYMAPERFGRNPVTPASDIYALGCTLVEGASGKGLFLDAVPVEMYQRAADKAIHDAFVGDFLDRVSVAAPVRELIEEMLAHDPAERPTAGMVARRCEDLAERLDGPSLKRWCRDRRWRGPSAFDGVFDGRVIQEATLPSGAFDKLPDVGATRDISDHDTYTIELTDEAATSGAETFPMDVGQISQQTLEPSPRRRSGPMALVALMAAAGFSMLVALPMVATYSPSNEPPLEASTEPVARAPAKVREVSRSAKGKRAKAGKTKTKTKAKKKTKRVAPKPVAAPAPAPEPAPLAVESKPKAVPVGTVRVSDPSVTVQLRGAGGPHRPGKAVPAGTYELWANFDGNGFDAHGRVEVVAGGVVVVKCNRLKYTCEVD